MKVLKFILSETCKAAAKKMNVTHGIKSLEGFRGKVQQLCACTAYSKLKALSKDSDPLSHYELKVPGITGLWKAAGSYAEILLQRTGSHDPPSRILG